MENPFKKLSRLIPKSRKKEEEIRYVERKIGNITVPLKAFGVKIDLEDIKFVSFHNVPPGLSSSSGAAYTQEEFNHFFKEFLGSNEAKMEFFSKKIMGKIIVTKQNREIKVSAVEFN
jgi:hypothetical protein